MTTPISSATSGTANRAATAVPASSEKQKVDYLKLIVAQMRNLNPMDPNSGGDSLPTMMQAESLNQLTQLNTALTTLQKLTQTSYASNLLGRTVSGADAVQGETAGVVTGLSMDATGPVLELSSGHKIRLLDVTSIATT